MICEHVRAEPAVWQSYIFSDQEMVYPEESGPQEEMGEVEKVCVRRCEADA